MRALTPNYATCTKHHHLASGCKPNLWLIQHPFSSESIRLSLDAAIPVANSSRRYPGKHGSHAATQPGLRGMVYQGKVTYKKDPNLVAWGCPEVQT